MLMYQVSEIMLEIYHFIVHDQTNSSLLCTECSEDQVLIPSQIY